MERSTNLLITKRVSMAKGEIMPRKVTLKKDQIWKNRADNYARYYEAHSVAMRLPDGTRQNFHDELSILEMKLDINGALDETVNKGKVSKGQFALRLSNLPETLTTLDFLAPWVWSKDDWNKYVQLFNALEDPTTDYEMKYSARTDTISYVPIEKYQNPVDKSRTSRVQL